METDCKKPSAWSWRAPLLLACAFGSIPILAQASVPSAEGKMARGGHWIGTWAAAAQSDPAPASAPVFQNQSLRLIVHTSAGGAKVRIRFSNLFGERQVIIGGAHIGRRAAGADIDPASGRKLTFNGQDSAKVEPHASVVSDPVAFDVPPLSDLAISLFFPRSGIGRHFTLVSQTNELCIGARQRGHNRVRQVSHGGHAHELAVSGRRGCRGFQPCRLDCGFWLLAD